MAKKNQNCEYMDVKTQQGVEKIPLRHVLYFTSDVRVVEAHMEKGKVFRFYGKLDDVQEELGAEDWLRCHKSFLVCRSRIRQITREYLYVGSEKIPISRNYYVKMRDLGLIGKDKEKLETMDTKNLGTVRCLSGKYEGMVYQIYPNEKLVIGRGYNQADIVLEEPEISRVHCWIQYQDTTDCYYVCNQSVNGIYINESRMEDRDCVSKVEKGDRIRLAETEEIFEIG